MSCAMALVAARVDPAPLCVTEALAADVALANAWLTACVFTSTLALLHPLATALE